MINYCETDQRFYFYRTLNGIEVDLIIELPGQKTYAIEIKSTNNPNPKMYYGLISFRSQCPDAELICVCLAPHKRLENGIVILPWQELFNYIGLHP